MERIILYPNTPEFELFGKFQPMIKEQMYEAFKVGFKYGHIQVSDYNEEQIKKFFKMYSEDNVLKDNEPLEFKHIILA
jgi:hypothetical protein